MAPKTQAPAKPMSNSSNVGMTPDQLAEAKQYGRLELLCGLADKAIDLLFLAAAAILLARPLDGWLQTVPWLRSCWSLRLVALFLAVTALHMAVSFPLSVYSGFWLERRFRLSTLSWAGWLWRWAKRNFLAAGLGAAMILGLYWLIWTAGGWWWLAAAGFFFLVSVALGQLFPVLILPLFYKIQRLDQPELAARIARLAEGTGLAIEGVYRMALSDETVKANAMLAGLGRTRRVLLGDTLLDAFSPDEIEVILAHEIGHHVFGHIRKMIVGGVFVSAAGFFLCDRLLGVLLGVGAGGPIDYAKLPVYTLPGLMCILTVFFTLLEPLGNLVSRRRERQCDLYALNRTGLKEAYVSAFRKLAAMNKDDPDPHWLDVFLFHSHPPIAERLAMADESSPSPSGRGLG